MEKWRGHLSKIFCLSAKPNLGQIYRLGPGESAKMLRTVHDKQTSEAAFSGLGEVNLFGPTHQLAVLFFTL